MSASNVWGGYVVNRPGAFHSWIFLVAVADPLNPRKLAVDTRIICRIAGVG
jgi:hypothetical protein